MTEKRILIVDDSFDLTRVLKTAIHTLDKSIKVKVVPSAEEAMLEFAREPWNLLISDIRLPGISGLEFLRKVRKKEKSLNIIMITGLTDLDLETKAREAGANFFLRKPIEIPLFMDAVGSYLGIDLPDDIQMPSNMVPELPIVARKEEEPELGNLTDTLVQIRGEIAAQAIYLLDENGQIAAQTGEFPLKNFEDKWLPALLPLLSAGEKFASFASKAKAQSVMVFRFDGQEILLLLLKDYTLLAVTANKRGALRLPLVIDSLVTYQDDLMAILGNMGAIPTKDQEFDAEQNLFDESEDNSDIDALDEEDEENLDTLLSILESEDVKQSQDVDQFWEKANEEVGFDLGNPDMISYEQAEKLGFTPGEATAEE
jgi:CheY-like chemotaxis protein